MTLLSSPPSDQQTANHPRVLYSPFVKRAPFNCGGASPGSSGLILSVAASKSDRGAAHLRSALRFGDRSYVRVAGLAKPF